MILRSVVALVALFALGAGCTAAPPPVAPAQTPAPAAAAPPGVASNQEAVREIEATAAGYVQAQQAFAAGDRARALELMNTAYLEHFERTEGWIDRAISQEYRQSVESAISRDLRRKLRDGAADGEIAAQFPIAFQRLQEAQARLAALP
jgi:hypothetical protein